MKPDPISGPIPREKFKELVNAPHGEAADVIREHDPFWGLAPGEKIDFEIEITATVGGGAIVRASSLEEAKKLAHELAAEDITFDLHDIEPWSIDVGEITPCRPAKKRRA